MNGIDYSVIGELMREVTRLHLLAQREDVACCCGNTSTQCLILMELGRTGPMALAELGRRLELDKGWVSRAVESLYREKLVTKAPSETDRRMVIVALTPAGETRYKKLDQAMNAQVERVMNRIPADERAGVVRALKLLRDALQPEFSAKGLGYILRGSTLPRRILEQR